MKTNITISVDIDTLLSAKAKVDNVSDYLNNCLKSLSESSISDDDSEERLKALDNTIQDAKIKRDILSMEMARKKELLADQALERESFKRWKCPVCKAINFLENDRCSNCNMKTKNDSKTEIVYTDEVKL